MSLYNRRAGAERSDLGPKRVRLASNRISQDFFSENISVHLVSSSHKVLKSVLNSPGFVTFWANLTQRWANLTSLCSRHSFFAWGILRWLWLVTVSHLLGITSVIDKVSACVFTHWLALVSSQMFWRRVIPLRHAEIHGWGGWGIGVERWGYGISMYLWRRVSHGNLCVNLNTAMVVWSWHKPNVLLCWFNVLNCGYKLKMCWFNV